MAEYDYWHERETAFSSIVEQLKKPTLLRITSILDQAKSPVLDNFIHYQVELKRYYSQAKDNVKFLSTILRQLKVILEYTILKQMFCINSFSAHHL